MMEELAHHGYRPSAGTLYPMLHGMEKKGYLTSHEERHGRAVRKLYVVTDLDAKLEIVRGKAHRAVRRTGGRAWA
jgi:DNA-binding PadR family transcriptional regulator